MKKAIISIASLLLILTSPVKSQILCINCFNTNDSISSGVTNMILNGSFENSTCTPNGNNNSWCPVSFNYNCNLANWTCTGGGNATYSQLFTTLYSAVPHGNVACYFGNAFCNVCGVQGDISCLSTAATSCEMTGVPAGLPSNDPVNYGGTNGLSLEQTVNGLTPGNVYVLEFWTGGEDFNAFIDPGMFGLDIGFGYTYLQTLPTDFGDIGLRYVVQWQATAASHTIKFTNWGHICNSCSELTLDHVRLYPISQLDPSVTPCLPQNLPFASIVGTNATCPGVCDGQATCNVINGTAPYTYLWSTTAVTPTITGLCPGNYSCTVTDANGNTSTANVAIGAGAGINVNTSITGTVCNDNSGTATATPTTGTGPYSYQWDAAAGNQVTQTALNLSPGNYNVTVTDANGCTGTGVAVIPVVAAPSAAWNFQVVSPCINNNSFNFNATGGNPAGTTYAWTFQNGNPAASAITNPSVTFSQVGANSVTLTVSANGCTDTQTQTINVLPLPVVNLGPDPTICAGSNATLDAGNAGSTFNWSNNAQTQTTVVGPGTYTVTVTNAGGCTNTDAITVNVSNPPVINLGPDQTLCEGQTITLDAGVPGMTYHWHPGGSSTQTVNVNTQDTYGVTVYNQFGCSGQDQVTILIIPEFSVNLGNDTILCDRKEWLIESGLEGYTYQWNTGSGEQNLLVTASGDYTVTVSNACFSHSDQIHIEMPFIPGPFMPNTFTPNGDGLNEIYPGPNVYTGDYFVLVIYDRWGKSIFEMNGTAGGWDGKIDNQDAPEGVYAYRVWTRSCDGKILESAGSVTLMR